MVTNRRTTKESLRMYIAPHGKSVCLQFQHTQDGSGWCTLTRGEQARQLKILKGLVDYYDVQDGNYLPEAAGTGGITYDDPSMGLLISEAEYGCITITAGSPQAYNPETPYQKVFLSLSTARHLCEFMAMIIRGGRPVRKRTRPAAKPATRKRARPAALTK